MRVHRFCNTKYCSVVALPSLTSWVHCSSGNLIPKALSMANAMSRKSNPANPQTLEGLPSRFMVMPGVSHGSAMMLATVSKVQDLLTLLSFYVFEAARVGAATRSELPADSAIRAGPYIQVRSRAQWRGGGRGPAARLAEKRAATAGYSGPAAVSPGGGRGPPGPPRHGSAR